MHNNFKAIGFSFKNTPLEIREAMALDENSSKKLLQFLKDFTNAKEAMVLSTCNRTEVYYSAESQLDLEIIKALALVKHIDHIEIHAEYFISYHNNDEAIQHLFDVSMGLESQVVGDMQISNQVKNAYQWSADEEMAGPFLHRLMHTIFFTHKRVAQETPFRDGAASVSYAATELVDELTTDIANPKILVLGLGEIGMDVCKNLASNQSLRVTIANRTLEKAEELAQECNFEVLPFENALQHVKHHDLVISSVAAESPILTKSFVQTCDILSYKFFIDLSVPRSIEKEVEDIPGALLYNIDNIQSKASKALATRVAAIPKVKDIISDAISDFNNWSKEMVVSPTINKLKNALEKIRKEEMARFLKDANEKETKVVDKVTKSMMQKIIKLPVLELKAACKRGEADTLIDVLNDLFDLENQPTKASRQ